LKNSTRFNRYFSGAVILYGYSADFVVPNVYDMADDT